MPVVNKLSFLSSSQRLTGSWLNAVQASVRFDGEERNNIDTEPSEFDEAGWAVNQRDFLLDWEHNPSSAIGNIGWGGRIINSDGETFAPATTTTRNTGVFIWVYGGRFQTVERAVLTWDTQLVSVFLGAEQYVYVDPITTTVVSTLSEPTTSQVPLARISIDNAGEITTYEDLRPTSFTVDFSNRTRSLQFGTSGLVNADYIITDWERVLADTSVGSLYIDLPSDPANNAEVSIVDSEGYFHLYPVFIRPAPGGINPTARTINGIDNDAFALDRRYGVYTLLYSEEKNGWYFIENQENKNFQRGTFITCGGRIPSTSTDCVAGSTPALFLDEEDPPIYEIVDGLCQLVYPETSGLYSNPSRTDSQGLQIIHMDGRCRNDDYAYISGGNTGFSNEETEIRINNANLILAEWETTILPALGTIPVGSRDVLFELLNRTAYAIQVGSYLHVEEMADNVPLLVTDDTRQDWYDTVISLLDPILLSEFANNLQFMNPGGA